MNDSNNQSFSASSCTSTTQRCAKLRYLLHFVQPATIYFIRYLNVVKAVSARLLCSWDEFNMHYSWSLIIADCFDSLECRRACQGMRSPLVHRYALFLCKVCNVLGFAVLGWLSTEYINVRVCVIQLPCFLLHCCARKSGLPALLYVCVRIRPPACRTVWKISLPYLSSS